MKNIIKLLVILTILSGFIFLTMTTPSVGKVTNKKEPLKKTTVESFETYKDEIVSFKYEDKFEVTKNGDSIQMVGKSGVPENIVVTIKPDKTGNIEDVPGVKMRRVKNSEFKEENLTNGVLFTKSNPMELTYFEIRKGKSIIAALTVNSNDEKKYRDELLKIISTIEIVTGL